MTLYLKYRPQQIADLDLVEVKTLLAKLLAAESLPHAFLFSGPRGTGKTSSARIVAKLLNCEKPKKGEPCNDCAACTSITNGSNPDLIEIDAASNRGIDEIRTLRDNINLSPMGAKYKVYIIDEVHMLTTEAANALLKTLEEPPAHAIFILCTTDPHKLPETVVSRCTRVNFKMPSLTEAVARLKKIADAESIAVDDEALELIAKAGKGSFRDEIKIFEQIWLGHKKVTLAETEEVLGMLESADPSVFVQLVKDKKTQPALDYVNDLVNEGVNVRTFIERVVEHLRVELLATKSVGTIALIEALDIVYEQTKTAAVTQLPLEIFIIQTTGSAIASSVSVDHKPASKSEPKAEAVVETAPAVAAAVIVQEPEVETVAPHPRVNKGQFHVADVVAKWPEILKVVRPKNHSVEALLRSTAPVDFDGQDLLLEVFYKFHKDKLESDKCRTIVEEAVSHVFSVTPVHLRLKLGVKQKNEEVSAENIGDDLVKAATEIFKIEAV